MVAESGSEGRPATATMLAELLRVTPAPLAARDRDGRYLVANPAWCALLGHTPDEVLGRTDDELLPREPAAAQRRDDQRVLASGEPLETDELIAWGGSLRRVLLSRVAQAGPDGTPAAVLVTAREVPLPTAAAEHLRLVTDHARCILSRAVVEGLPGWRTAGIEAGVYPFHWREVEVLNPDAADRLLPLALAPGESWYAAWARSREPAHQRQADLRFALALLHGDSEFRNDWQCVDRDGRSHWQQQVTAIEPLGPDRWQLFAITMDVTALREAQERLAQVARQSRCILTRVLVEALPGWRERLFTESDAEHPFLWREKEVLNLDTAQELLPLTLAPGQSYYEAWRLSRDPAHHAAASRRFREAVRDGAATYRNDWRVVGSDGQSRWQQQVVSVEALGDDRWQLFGVTIDTTEQHAAEELLQSVARHARCILNAGIVEGAPDWRERALETACERVPFDWRGVEIVNIAAAQEVLPLEVPEGERYALAWWRSRHDDDQHQANFNGGQALLSGASSYTNEYRCTDRYGELHWLRQTTTVQPLDERHWRVFGIAMDVTAQRQAEEARRAEAERLLEVARYGRCVLRSGVMTLPPNWRELSEPRMDLSQVAVINPEAAQEVLPLAWAPGETYHDAWLRSRNPADVRVANAAALNAMRAGESVFRTSVRSTDRDGQEHWIEQVVTLRQVDECSYRAFSIALDVTELRLAEQALRRDAALLRSAKELAGLGVYDHNLVTGEIEWDTRTRELHGVGHDEAITADAAFAAVVPEDVPPLHAALAAASQPDGPGGYTCDYRVRLDGRERWYTASARTLFEQGQAVRRVGIVLDVTQHREAEAELRAVLTRARCLLWHADVYGDDGWESDPGNTAGRLRWYLQVADEGAAQEVLPLAVPPGCNYAQAWFASRLEDEQQNLRTRAVAHAALLNGEPGYRQVLRHVDRHGVGAWLQEDVTITPLGPGHWQLVGVVVDITAQKQAEESIRQSEQVLRSAQELSGLGVFRHELATGELEWDDRMRALWGLAPGEPVDVQLTAACLHPADTARIFAAIARSEDPAGDGWYTVEFRTLGRHDRRVRWVALVGRTVFEEGRPVRRIGTVLDITAHRQAEAELREVLTNARCILWRADLQCRPGWRDDPTNAGRTLVWRTEVVDERAAQQVLPLDVPPGSTYSFELARSHRPADADRPFVTAHAALLADERFYERDVCCHDRTGRLVWLHERTTLQPAGPDQWAVFGVFTDVTERVQAEEQRREFERRLRQSERLESLGVLAGGIAHDFNNLLTAILGSAELVSEELQPGGDGATFLAHIQIAARRAAELCRQMLVYAGKGRLVSGPVDLTALVQELARLLRASVPKRVALVLDLPADLAAVRGDASQLRQVVMNLVINASEAIGEQDGAITVTADEVELGADDADAWFGTERPRPGHYVRLTVADTGCGLAPELLERIFEPFFTTKFTGRGLGLSAVLGIVRGHGAGLQVESEEGRGSTFRVLLPADTERPAEAPAPTSAGLPQFGATVLLVDDEPALLQIGSRLLRQLGCAVLTANDGAEAVALYRARHAEIHLVLLDVSMPRLSGVEAYRQLRELNPEVAVVVASGHGLADTAERFAGLPLVAMVSKPYTRAELCDVLGPWFAEHPC